MELTGFDAADIRARRVARKNEGNVVEVNDVPVTALIHVGESSLEFTGERYVPTLRFSGVLAEVRSNTEAQLPYDVRTVRFSQAVRTKDFVVDYEFTNNQLQSLVAKGLYLNGFDFEHDKIRNADVELPAKASFIVVPPSDEANPPVVSVDLDLDPFVRTNLAESGYDFEAELAPDYRGRLLEEGHINEAGMAVEQEHEQVNDLFAGVPLPEFKSSLYGTDASAQREGATRFLDLAGVELASVEELNELIDERNINSTAETSAGQLVVDGKFGRAATEFFNEQVAQQRQKAMEDREVRLGRSEDTTVSDLAEVDGLEGSLEDFDDLDLGEIEGIDEADAGVDEPEHDSEPEKEEETEETEVTEDIGDEVSGDTLEDEDPDSEKAKARRNRNRIKAGQRNRVAAQLAADAEKAEQVKKQSSDSAEPNIFDDDFEL